MSNRRWIFWLAGAALAAAGIWLLWPRARERFTSETRYRPTTSA